MDASRLRILYSFPDTVGKTGIGVTALHQVRALTAQGWRVHLYCTNVREDPGEVEKTVATLTLAGQRLPHRLVGVDRAYRFHDRVVAAALRRLKPETVDLVHCWPRAAIATATAAREMGVPVVREVVSSHTGYVYDVVARETAQLGVEPAKGSVHTFDRDRLRREEEEFRLADYLLVPSDFSRRTFLDRNFTADRLLMHQYGYDPARFFSNGGRPPSPNRPFTALFAGRCEPLKGLHHALRAWFDSGAAATGRMIICGSFVGRYREAVARWLEHPSVEFRGFVTDLERVMRASDVLLLPSIVEGSALVTYEAQASGCVLLASDASGARCDHEKHGLIHAAGDVETLTRQLRRLVEHPEELGRLRAAAIEHARYLTWERAGADLERAYATALGHGVSRKGT